MESRAQAIPWIFERHESSAICEFSPLKTGFTIRRVVVRLLVDSDIDRRMQIPYQDLETKQLCFDLLHRPQEFEALITRTTMSAATSMAYGFRVMDPEDPTMKELLRNAHGFFTMAQKSQFFDWYPQLRPIAKWLPPFVYTLYSDARRVFHREKKQFHDLLDDTRETMGKGNTLPSMPRRNPVRLD